MMYSKLQVTCIIGGILEPFLCECDQCDSISIYYVRQRRKYTFLPVFVCLLARLLKNACMDLDEMLLVDRCRDMDKLINF